MTTLARMSEAKSGGRVARVRLDDVFLIDDVCGHPSRRTRKRVLLRYHGVAGSQEVRIVLPTTEPLRTKMNDLVGRVAP